MLLVNKVNQSTYWLSLLFFFNNFLSFSFLDLFDLPIKIFLSLTKCLTNFHCFILLLHFWLLFDSGDSF
jgi:hypothetical protein